MIQMQPLDGNRFSHWLTIPTPDAFGQQKSRALTVRLAFF
jgi:hypothetical protein